MLWFPQLATGANGQFPALRRIVRRTVISEQPDGRLIALADADAAAMEWTLELRGLSAAETAAIEDLFAACEGRLGTFTFLDPFDNLLRWSEDLTAAAWIKDAGVTTVSGAADPFGGANAMTVSGSGEIAQTVQAPGGLRYCFSTWVRGQAITLAARAGGVEAARSFEAGATWRRVTLAAKLDPAAEATTFAIAASGGAELFGLQVDAQLGPSAYKRTTSRSGVYGAARFMDDALTITDDGPGSSACKLRIRAPWGD